MVTLSVHSELDLFVEEFGERLEDLSAELLPSEVTPGLGCFSSFGSLACVGTASSTVATGSSLSSGACWS
jgi:hypothetical protein